MCTIEMDGERGNLEIRAELPGWSAPDGRFLSPDGMPGEGRPNEEIDFSLELTIGTRGDAATSRFALRITTPEALLAAAPEATNVLAARATLVVSQLDWDGIRAHLKRVLVSCDSASIEAATPLLQQYFRWEFDDFGRTGRRNEGHTPLEVRDVVGPDGCAFRSLYPWDGEQVDYLVQLMVGPRGEAYGAVFETRIVTPERLNLEQDDGEFRVLAHQGTLIVAHFDWRDVLPDIENIVSRCGAERFHESVWRLRRYFTLRERYGDEP